MEISELNPYVRYMDQRTCTVSYEKPVLAYDHRLFAVREGTCGVETEGSVLPGNQHSILLLPPAVPYRMLYDSQRPAILFDVNFTLGYARGPSLPPDSAEAFDPSRMPEQADCLPFQHAVLIKDAGDLFPLLSELLRQHERGGEYAPELCASLLKTVLIRCLQKAKPQEGGPSPLSQALMRYLEEHCREALSAAAVGEAFGYHPFHLNRLLNHETGWTMHRYQTECRMKRACSMLANTRLSVGEIADSLGFSRDVYFSEVFRRLRGMPPTEYRRQHQERNTDG